ncbi:MAG TPA: SDR family oxidoreductase, partial [Chthoniobacterales bacterium]|nr:SDR family oxidoreductase [Chthoniobacterales bacterium]
MNQHIVITGAASGLGCAVCRRFAQSGATVYGIDINEPALQDLKSTLGERFVPVSCDVSHWEDVDRVFQRFSQIDVLVNSAGITGKTNLKSHDTDPVDVERVFRLNFFGCYHTAKAALPRM